MQRNFYLTLFLPVLVLLQLQAFGQAYTYETEVPLLVEQNSLKMSWAGGLNAVQANNIDTNGDGQPELVLFDRSSSQVQVFAQTTEGWKWLPEERWRFPADLRNWMLLVDYNADGQKDLFTFTAAGIRVFENTAAEGGAAKWKLSYELLYYAGTTAAVNLLVNNGDIPIIADTDGDGDIDITAFDPAGSGRIRRYRNVGVEQYNRTDTLAFVLADAYWEGITECHCDAIAVNSAPCPPHGGKANMRPQHAGGKSLLWKDLSGDGVPDLLIGDEECNILYYLPNSGTAADPFFEQAINGLPGATTVSDFPFPAAYSIEGFAGTSNPILISTNLRSAGTMFNLQESVWLYEQASPGNYVLQQRDFLHGQMLDIGEEARPTFLDIDGDGDQDMLLGSRGLLRADGYYAGLQLLENTGSPNAPAFGFKNDNYLGLAANKYTYLLPQSVDFNGDGAIDLIVTAMPAGSNRLQTQVWINKATSDKPVNFASTPSITLPLSLSTLDYPYFYDVTADGLLDIVVGRFDGSLQLYTNTGTAQTPAYTLSQSAYKGFALDNVRRPLIPTVGDADANGSADLLLADGTGQLRILSDFLSSEATSITAMPAFIHIGDTLPAARLGDRSWPVLASLWQDEAPTLVVGQIGGGVVLLRSDLESLGGGEELALDVYPNPAINEPIKFRANQPVQLQILNILGQPVARLQLRSGQIAIWKPNLPAGLYIIEATSASGRITKKIMIGP